MLVNSGEFCSKEALFCSAHPLLVTCLPEPLVGTANPEWKSTVSQACLWTEVWASERMAHLLPPSLCACTFSSQKQLPSFHQNACPIPLDSRWEVWKDPRPLGAVMMSSGTVTSHVAVTLSVHPCSVFLAALRSRKWDYFTSVCWALMVCSVLGEWNRWQNGHTTNGSNQGRGEMSPLGNNRSQHRGNSREEDS